jgi:hypothetical protein
MDGLDRPVPLLAHRSLFPPVENVDVLKPRSQTTTNILASKHFDVWLGC